uniref:Guanylyl cyclase-activating protein 2 n=1 Tax=Astyanax mexicanus TaxID=7994 RepID=A0A8B9JI77_ASTMX
PTGEASEYAENMFRAFDKNGDNTIDFLEFVAALNLVFRGDLEHKLRWSFKVYDKDGNGFVDREELRAIYSHPIKSSELAHWASSMLSCSERCGCVISTLKTRPISNITLDEFVEGAKKDPWILNMLRLDMNPYSWVLDQKRRKSAHF